MVKQNTIKEEVSISGVGLHTGESVNMKICPAPPNHGVKFKRVDLENTPIVKADVDYVVDVSRGTTLELNGVRVATVEHVLAALKGCEVDNVMIELDSSEVPIMDGSSKVFVDVLGKAGIDEQDEERLYFELTENLHYSDTENQVDMVAIPATDYQVTVMIDFNSKVLGSQHAHFDSIKQFNAEFADARTFCFLHELEFLLEHNLIKGGDLDNAIVVVDHAVQPEEISKLAGLFNKPSIEVKEEGILNNIDLRYANEPARHKLLDVVGDLSLIGIPLKAKIIASRPGHAANIEFARQLKKHIKKMGKVVVPHYDPNAEPVYDIKTIQNWLPHKYPFLLVDKVIEMSETHVVGLKNVTFNEPFFTGHFPGNPIMPGVLQIEAMAQVGGMFVLRTVDEPWKYDTLFLKIENAKFKSMVIPGDTLIIKMELLGPIRRGICEMKGTVFVGNKICAEANMVARIVKREEV